MNVEQFISKDSTSWTKFVLISVHGFVNVNVNFPITRYHKNWQINRKKLLETKHLLGEKKNYYFTSNKF